jgi:hypothetical protein
MRTRASHEETEKREERKGRGGHVGRKGVERRNDARAALYTILPRNRARRLTTSSRKARNRGCGPGHEAVKRANDVTRPPRLSELYVDVDRIPR